MATRTISTTYEAEVTIIIDDDAPDDVLTRCFTDEWRESFYRFADEGDVIDHFAFNAIVNGMNDVSQLDGWADLPEDAVRIEVQ